MQLTQAEAAFRAEKDQFNLRPIWHWCFLAYV